MAFVNNGRFTKFENKVWLSSPTMYPESMRYVMEAYETNWMSTVGANINEVEKVAAEISGTKYAVALSCGTAALHLCMKLAGEKLYGKKVVLKVARDANKIQIRQAVESAFGVKVTNVNTVSVRAKKKRVGRYEGTTKAYKKAIRIP